MILPEFWRHRPIRERDASGVLIAAGYRWDQYRILEMTGFGAFATIMLILAPVMYANHSPPAGVACAAAGLAMLMGLAWVVKHPRIIVLTRDGRVRAPNGITGRFWVRDLGSIAEVASIELTSSCRDSGVVLFTTEGRTILLAESMRKVDARLVAVQLTKALHEMRQSLASVGNRRHRMTEAAQEFLVH